MKPKGKNFLLVTGIIIVICAGITLLTSVIGLSTIDIIMRNMEQTYSQIPSVKDTFSSLGIPLSRGYYITSYISSIISSTIWLIAGILGIVLCKRPEKAQINLVMGILMFAYIVIQNIIFAALGYMLAAMAALGIILGAILPVLYLIGAVLNKKSVFNQ